MDRGGDYELGITNYEGKARVEKCSSRLVISSIIKNKFTESF